MLLWLKKAKRNFKLAFRSSGREIKDTVQEFNAFCEGNHPSFNGDNGTHKVYFNNHKGPDLRVKDKNLGMFFKFGPLVSNMCLVSGSLDRKQGEDLTALAQQYKLELEENKIHFISDPVDIYMCMMDVLSSQGSIAYQDDYMNFANHDFDPAWGKSLIIDQSDPSVQHIFLDDNA